MKKLNLLYPGQEASQPFIPNQMVLEQNTDAHILT